MVFDLLLYFCKKTFKFEAFFALEKCPFFLKKKSVVRSVKKVWCMYGMDFFSCLKTGVYVSPKTYCIIFS